MMKTVFLLFLLLFFSTAFAQTKVALVKMVRGEAKVLTLGKTEKIKVDDWLEQGAVVKTADKSFVKLVFVDKSQMNVGPNSEMKIESFSGKDSGVIDLVKGKIRSQVTKDYLQIKDRDKSKLFIKTQNAVMGVRGTDFMIATNGRNTSTILFEGEIAFNKLDNRSETSTRKLEDVVDRGVRMFPGEFSVMEANRPMPTVPSLLNVQQREHLEKNKEFSADRGPGSGSSEPVKSVVPEGLSGAQVGNDVTVIKEEMAQINSQETAARTTPSSADPEGYVKGNLIKPANGSFVHVESGIIIPPGPTAVLDKNSNTYIPGPDSGRVRSDGTYVPPSNVVISNDGKLLVTVTDANGNVVQKEVLPPPPIVTSTSVPISGISLSGTTTTTPTTTTISDVSLPGTNTVDSRFTPTGGYTGATDPTRQTGVTDTTINVRPPPNY